MFFLHLFFKCVCVYMCFYVQEAKRGCWNVWSLNHRFIESPVPWIECWSSARTGHAPNCQSIFPTHVWYFFFSAVLFHIPWLAPNSWQSSCLNILRAEISGINLQDYPGENIGDNEIGDLTDSNSVFSIPERSELLPERPQERSYAEWAAVVNALCVHYKHGDHVWLLPHGGPLVTASTRTKAWKVLGTAQTLLFLDTPTLLIPLSPLFVNLHWESRKNWRRQSGHLCWSLVVASEVLGVELGASYNGKQALYYWPRTKRVLFLLLLVLFGLVWQSPDMALADLAWNSLCTPSSNRHFFKRLLPGRPLHEPGSPKPSPPSVPTAVCNSSIALPAFLFLPSADQRITGTNVQTHTPGSSLSEPLEP